MVEYPHSAIGPRLSTTKVYENNVPSVDWHSLKNFKAFWKVCESFFSLSLVLSPNSWTAPESTGQIYKQIHFSENKIWMTSIYTFRMRVCELLIACLTQFWQCYRIFFNTVCSFFSFFLCVALCMQLKINLILVSVMRMWKRENGAVGAPPQNALTGVELYVV